MVGGHPSPAALRAGEEPDGNDDPFVLIRTVLEGVELVPKPHQQYQPLIVDGLIFFLSRLPAARLEQIVAAQFELGDEAAPEERLGSLLRQCPTLHMGQVVAHDQGLPELLRRRLEELETLPPSADFSQIRAIIEGETRDVEGLELGDEALAEGSVASVVPFTWRGTAGREPVRGVFKVLKPHAEEHMREELAIWPQLSNFLEVRSRDYGLPALDYGATLEGVGKLLLKEISLEHEQANLAWAARYYAGMPSVAIPRLLPFSTPRMTAMERIDGRKVTDRTLPTAVRRDVAKTIVKALLAKPFWQASVEDARFHADPHAGNLFVTEDGRLAIFDWALTTELHPAQLAAVVRALLGALTLDEGAAMAAIAVLGRIVDHQALSRAVSEAVGRVRAGKIPGFVWLTDLLDRLGRAGAVAFPEETALFRKSLLTLSGVVDDVSDGVHFDDIMIRGGLLQFAGELGGRLMAPLEARRFGSHVSNGDIVRTWIGLPWWPARYWLNAWRVALESPRLRAQPR